MQQEQTRMRRPGGTPPPERAKAEPKAEKDENPFVKGDANKRKQGILELMDFALMPLAVKATTEQMKMDDGQVSVYSLDLYTAQQFKEPYADLIVKLSDEYPVVGLLLDRFTQVGPLASVLTLTLALGAQIAENHNRLSDSLRGTLPVIPRDDIGKVILDQANERKSAGNGNG